MKTKKLKYAVISSVVAICLCLALLAGSTYAWFTDTLVSSGNVIEAGSVKIDAEVYEPVVEPNTGIVVKDSSESDLSVYPIISRSELTTVGTGTFNTPIECGDATYYGNGTPETYSFDLSEEGTSLEEDGALLGSRKGGLLVPGESEPYARIVRIHNTGSLEAAVKFGFSASGVSLSDLWCSALDVEYSEEQSGSITIAEGESFEPAPMSENNYSNDAETVIAPGDSVYLLLLFGIYADAGNGVQGKTFDLVMSVLATQSVGHKGEDSGIQAEFPDWDGVACDTSWYVEGGSEFTLYTGAELAGLAAIVNGEGETGGDHLANTVIKLGADIDLGGYNWTPIGHQIDSEIGHEVTTCFEGDFNGQGHTIYNLVVEPGDEEEKSQIGLFGHVFGGRFENVNIHNVTVTGEKNVGALIGSSQNGNSSGGAYGQSCIVTNCHVSGIVKISGNHQVGGLIGGSTQTEVTNCSVDAVSGSYVKSVWADGDDMDGDNAGGIIGCYSPNSTYESEDYVHEISGLFVSGLEISATRKAGGLIGYYSGSDNATMENCSVSDCVVSITYGENVTSTNLFVGALIGEYAMALTVLGGNSVANVDVWYIYENCIGALADDGSQGTYLLFGGYRDSNNGTASVAFGEIEEGSYYSVEVSNLNGYKVSVPA